MSSKYPIILIGPYPPLIGGVSTHLFRALPLLIKDGHKASVISVKRTDSKDPSVSYIPALLLPFYLFVQPKSIVHFHVDSLSHLLLSAMLKLRHKTFLTVHNNRYPTKMLGSSIQVRIKWFLLNKFKKIICVNPDTKLFLEEKLTNVHNQVIPAFLPPTKIDKSSVSFIKDYCSKFDYVLSGYAYRFSFFEGEDLYGTDLMIDLIDRLTKKEINAVLVLLISMEETPYFGKITQKINNLNLEQNILLIDINKGVDAVALWQMSDIYLRPTNTDGNSISILEALSVGSSVVASDCVERPESCILFRNRDIEDFETVVTTSLQSKSHTYMAPDLSHLFFDLYEDIAQKQ